MRLSTTLPLAFVAAFVGGLALNGPDLGHAPWAVSRASGIASFAVLSASVVFGLLMSTKAADGLVSRPLAVEMHQFLSVLALALIGLHAGALLFDGFLTFTPASVVVPFASPYRPLWVGLGVVGAWATAGVTASFWARKRLGQKAWRRLHHASFGTYALGLLHGIGAGTDTQAPLVYWMYVVSAALVLALTTYRILQARAAPPRRRMSAPRIRRPAGAASA